MPGRVEGKVALVMGGGQTPGETIGNGRATALLLGREGARVFVVDLDGDRAAATCAEIRREGGQAESFAADVRQETDVQAAVVACVKAYGRLDLLHNNIGGGLSLGDESAVKMSVEAWDRVFEVNLRGMWLACKWAIPVMQEHGGGSIVNISSAAAHHKYPRVGYKTTKVAVIGLTEYLAAEHAGDMIRVNTILPGLMETPMAIEPRVAEGVAREVVIAERNRQVPLGKKMGSGWDVAYAALFLHSDEARFISGVALPVDGAMLVSS